MSYARFSDLRGQCDVYVYESDDGYVTHVAGIRPRGPAPAGADPTDLLRGDDVTEWMALHSAIRAWWSWVPRLTISLPSAGKSFCDEDAAACAARLQALRAEGFIVPDWVIEELIAEAAREGRNADR